MQGDLRISGIIGLVHIARVKKPFVLTRAAAGGETSVCTEWVRHILFFWND